MGLEHDERTTEPEGEEVDEDVKRRNFLAVTGTVLFGAPVFGVPELTEEPRTLRDVLAQAPERVGAGDVARYGETVARLGVLDREAGGMAAREALAATATTGERLLSAQMAEPVRQELLYTVSEAHRLAGWASGDVGLVDHCRWHLRRAVDFAAGDNARVAQVLCSAGDMEKHHGAPNDALKLFQLAQINVEQNWEPQAAAVVAGLSASPYLAMGHSDKARASVQQSRRLFAEAQGEESQEPLPFFAFYGPGHGLLAATGSKLTDYEPAHADVQAALRTRPEYDVRCNALDTIVLATVLLNAGELAEGIAETRRALSLATEVGSQRVRDRLEPLERALAARRDTSCQELARAARALRSPQSI